MFVLSRDPVIKFTVSKKIKLFFLAKKLYYQLVQNTVLIKNCQSPYFEILIKVKS